MSSNKRVSAKDIVIESKTPEIAAEAESTPNQTWVSERVSGQDMTPIPAPKKPFPFNLVDEFEIVLGQNGTAYVVSGDGKPYVAQIGSREIGLRIRASAESEGKILRKSDLSEINEYLQAWAEQHGEQVDVYYRVRPIEGGVEFDVGDPDHSRIRVTAGQVEVFT